MLSPKAVAAKERCFKSYLLFSLFVFTPSAAAVASSFANGRAPRTRAHTHTHTHTAGRALALIPSSAGCYDKHIH